MATIKKLIIGAEASVNFQKGIVHFELELDGNETQETLHKIVTQTKAIATSEAHQTALALSTMEKPVEQPAKKEYAPAPKKEWKPAEKPAYTPKPAQAEYVNIGSYPLSEGQKKLLAFRKVPKDVELCINSYQEFNDFVKSL